MVPFLIFRLILSLLVVLLSSRRRDRRFLAEARSALQVRGTERTNELEKANAGTFGWKVRSGELVWSDETYRILGFARETR
jgi:hypothetical protein